MVYLDASPVIYFVEQPPVWGPKATARFQALRRSGETLAVSDLTRMECRVGPLKKKDLALLADFHTFFTASSVHVLTLTPAVYDQAAVIRATYGFKPLDSLHLATAVEHGCTRFLTNDLRLNKFTGIAVEVL
jgi:predicted nucleic acid-binding protein